MRIQKTNHPCLMIKMLAGNQCIYKKIIFQMCVYGRYAPGFYNLDDQSRLDPGSLASPRLQNI